MQATSLVGERSRQREVIIVAIISRKNSKGQSRYVARVWDPVLHHKVNSRTFGRRKDAEVAEAEMKLKIHLGEPLVARRDVTLEAFAQEVLDTSTASETTKRDYQWINSLLFESLGRRKSLRSITPSDVEKAVRILHDRYSPNTVNKAIVRLRHILRRAITHGYLITSPAAEIANKPKVTTLKKMRVLDDLEAKRLLVAAGYYWSPLFTLWLATGMRRAEIFGLELDCLDVRDNRVHVRQQLKDGQIVPFTKSRRPRTVNVSAEVMSIVIRHFETAPRTPSAGQLVFPSERGKPVHFSDFNRSVFKRIVAAAGVPELTTHDLRHTFASQALSRGVNIKVVQEMLGHQDAQLTLNTYSHLIPSDGRTAAQSMSDFVLK